jgi:hypothetical protein
VRFIFYLDHPLIRQLKAVLQWKMPGAQRQCIQIVLLRASGMMQLVLLRAAARRGPTRVIVCQCVLHRSDDARARPPFEIFLKTLAQKCLPATHPAAPGPWQQNLWDEIREKIFENCALKSMKDVCCQA